MWFLKIVLFLILMLTVAIENKKDDAIEVGNLSGYLGVLVFIGIVAVGVIES